MWFVVILTLCSAALPQYDFINEYRLHLGWAQVGVFEIGLAVGLVYALLKGGEYAGVYPRFKTHPLFVWLMILFALGTAAGLIGSITANIPIKHKVAAAREFSSMAICVLLGYRLLIRPQQLMSYVKATVVAGLITVALVFWYFDSASDKVHVTGSVHWLRDSIKQVSAEFASVVGLLLLWSLAAGRRILRPIPAFVIMILCFVGYLATLGRTNVVVMLGGAVATLLIIPKGRRMLPVTRLVLFGPVIIALLYLSMLVGGKIVGRENFAEKILDHFATLLPSERRVGEHKAWDSRLGSIGQEFDLWLQSPLFGHGFASQNAMAFSGEIESTGAYNHNGWTGTLAMTGIFGFAAVFLLITGSIVIGYRLVQGNTSPELVAIGALAFVTGADFFLRVSCTMALASRFAIQFATVCGLAIRAREIEQTIRATREAGVFDVPVDPETGMIIPDYRMPGFGGFGSAN